MTDAMSIFVRQAGCFSLTNMTKSYWQIRGFIASPGGVVDRHALFIYGLGFQGWMWCNGPLGKLASRFCVFARVRSQAVSFQGDGMGVALPTTRERGKT
jgi:hypothetical protein